MAKLTGGGFTNLPADKATLEAKLARSRRASRAKARARQTTSMSSCWRTPKAEQIRGTCQMFGAGRQSTGHSTAISLDADAEERGAGPDLPQPDAHSDHRP